MSAGIVGFSVTGGPAAEPPDAKAFLAALKARDATVDNVHLRYERHGEGENAPSINLSPDAGPQDVLPPKVMKYCYRMEVVLRGLDVTQVRIVDEGRTETAEGYPRLMPFHKWSNKGGVCRELSDSGHGTRMSKTLEVQHNSAWSSVILEQLMQVEFALGYGFGKRFQDISALTATPTGWTVTGPFKIWGDDTGTCTLELDKDYVARRAVVNTVSRSNNLWRFEVETADAVRTDRVVFAKTGHFKQTYLGHRSGDQVTGAPDVRDDFRVTFVDATYDLSDAAYDALTDLSPPPSSILVNKDTGEQFAVDEKGNQKPLGNYEPPPPPVRRSALLTTVLVAHAVLFTGVAVVYLLRRRSRPAAQL